MVPIEIKDFAFVAMLRLVSFWMQIFILRQRLLVYKIMGAAYGFTVWLSFLFASIFIIVPKAAAFLFFSLAVSGGQGYGF